MTFEDNHIDVLNKAQRGLGWTDLQLMQHSGLSMLDIHNCRAGADDEESLWKLAEALQLKPEALILLARSAVVKLPGQVPHPLHLVCLNAPAPVPGYEEMTVNSYLVACLETGDACLVDAGCPPHQVRKALQERDWNLKKIFLTHAHRDHIQQLEPLRSAFPGCECLAPENECPQNCSKIMPGFQWQTGLMRVQARSTPGHSPDGMSYVFQQPGATQTVICCGDALFARSIGKVPSEMFASALSAIRHELLSHPDNSIIAPGHGPITTVANELAYNPFFA